MGTSSWILKNRNGGLGTSGDPASTYYETLGFSGDTASKGLFLCLDSPLTSSLPGEGEDLGSFSIFSIFCLPQWSHSKWWSSFSQRVSRNVSPGSVHARAVSFFSQSFSVFYPLADPFPALDMLPDSLRLLSLISILPPFATPLTGGARVPFHLVGNIVAF